MLAAKAIRPKRASFLAGAPICQVHPSAEEAPVPGDTRVPTDQKISSSTTRLWPVI